jgi:nucleotide-binding universal stress UspA family protein
LVIHEECCFHKAEVEAMNFKTVMVQLDIDFRAAPRLTFAWEVARRFEADLIAFCAAEPRLLLPGDVDGTGSEDGVERQVAAIEGLLDVRKSEVDDLARDSGRVSWRGMVGDPTRLLALHARAADLLVLGVNNSGMGRLRTVDPGELILSAGRPVLFTNRDYRPMTAENVLIAWKDTREARRAIVDAMPLLVRARQVLVSAVEEDDRAAARDSTTDVVRFLRKHGVKARSDVLDVGHADVTEVLLEMAVEIGADLTVSGGYGHSRLREWAFGGVTRALLKDSSLNRLIAN